MEEFCTQPMYTVGRSGHADVVYIQLEGRESRSQRETRKRDRDSFWIDLA